MSLNWNRLGTMPETLTWLATKKGSEMVKKRKDVSTMISGSKHRTLEIVSHLITILVQDLPTAPGYKTFLSQT